MVCNDFALFGELRVNSPFISSGITQVTTYWTPVTHTSMLHSKGKDSTICRILLISGFRVYDYGYGAPESLFHVCINIIFVSVFGIGSPSVSFCLVSRECSRSSNSEGNTHNVFSPIKQSSRELLPATDSSQSNIKHNLRLPLCLWEKLYLVWSQQKCNS